MRRLTEEELRELAKRKPAGAAYLRRYLRREDEREQQQKAEREAAIMDKMDGVLCGGIEEGYRSSTGEVIRERRFSAPTQQPSPQAARRATGTEPDTQPPETLNIATGQQ
jgi:hypothetical protein